MDIYESKKESFRRRFEKMSDLSVRELCYGKLRICIFYISNFCSKNMIADQVIDPLSAAYGREGKIFSVESSIASASLSTLKSEDEAEEKLLAGSAVLMYDGSSCYALSVGTKNEEGRSGNEPDTENVIRGPHEGFTENGESNAMLIRRRLHTAKLKKLNFSVGTESKTDVAIMYMEGIARESLVAEVIRRIENIDVATVTDSGTVEICIQDGKYALFPTVGNSERPDKVAAKLAEGRVAIIVDGSPVVLTVPYLFCEGFQVTEDYAKSPWYASFVRLLRLAAMAVSVWLPAVFTAILTHHEYMVPPATLDVINKSREGLATTIFSEVIVVFLLFELVREVGLRMPKAVGSAVGLVGALLLGDSAIEAGIASSSVLIIVALAALCNFIVPPYMNPSVIYRSIMILLAGFFGLYGFFIGFVCGVLFLAGKSSFGVPYLSPIAPISPEGMRDFPIMTSIPQMKTVPASITGKRIKRTGKEKEK